MSSSRPLLGAILDNCATRPEKKALHWLNEECEVERDLSYGELEARTRRLARKLLEELPLKRRERAVLCYLPGLDFIQVFLACLRAGVIPVPVSPPNSHHLEYTTETLVKIIFDARATCVLSNDQFLEQLPMEQLLKLREKTTIVWCSTSGLEEEEEEEGDDLELDDYQPEDIAFLQYTSGSTGSPKGVMVTFSNLQHNLEHIIVPCLHATSSSIDVSFLPHYHDLGLIGCYLLVLYLGASGYYMSPFTFIKRPSILVQALSKFRGTHGKAPNFAFELIVSRGFPPDVDLSSVQCLANGAEPVDVGTMKQFQVALAPHGLKRGVARGAYGLAEHTLFATCATDEEAFVTVGPRINCGKPLPAVTLKIVDPETCIEVEEGEEGEIWLHSGSVAAGYWEKEEASVATFEARIAGEPEPSYLRTGDLGSMKDSRLFVSGRSKDLIISRGQNIHPQDIELRMDTLCADEPLRSGRNAAFQYEHTVPANPTVADPNEMGAGVRVRRGVGYVTELRRPGELDQHERTLLAEKLAVHISVEFQVEVVAVAFLGPRTIPRTTSGKKQRSACRLKLANGTLNEIYKWVPKGDGDKLEEASRETSQKPPQRKASKHLKPTAGKSAPLPTTPSHRHKLSLAPPEGTPRSGATMSPATKRRNSLNTLTAVIGQTLGTDQLRPTSNIWTHGCNSILVVQISERLKRELGFAVEPHVLFTHQTPQAIMEKLQRSLLGVPSPDGKEEVKKSPMPRTRCERETTRWQSEAGGDEGEGVWPLDMTEALQLSGVGGGPAVEIASRSRRGGKEEAVIVGMACTFAGCSNLQEFWTMLVQKDVSVAHVVIPGTAQVIHGSYTRAVGIFDHEWFGIPDFDAVTMDPQQAMLLHGVSECLHHAGYSRERLQGSKVGVFVGVCNTDARVFGQTSYPLPAASSLFGSMVANRVSHVFDFTGPSVAIDTACASSLSALHQACYALEQKECTMALVAGVNAILDPNSTLMAKDMGILSPEGKCCVFDESADGYVRGEGYGVVLLEKSSEAERNGDRILARIKSTVTNHSGSSATLTSPNGLAQQELFLRAVESAEIFEADLCYVEAHGTGTKLGDPIEVDAVHEVYGTPAGRTHPLIVGSAKANVGHLEGGAGIVGVIKTVLVLEHATAPGNANLDTINPAFGHHPEEIKIPTENTSLEGCYVSEKTRLCAGVNSFGFGGSNVTAILQQHSRLPHLGRTRCTVVLRQEVGGCDPTVSSPGKSLAKTVAMLLSAPEFKKKYSSILTALATATNSASKPSSRSSAFYLKSPAVLTFLLYSGTVSLLQSLGTDVVLLHATDVVGELAVLEAAGVMVLTDAARLLLMGSMPKRYRVQGLAGMSLRKPSLPFFSHVLGSTCSGPSFPTWYQTQLTTSLRKGNLLQTASVQDGVDTIAPSDCPTLQVIVTPRIVDSATPPQDSTEKTVSLILGSTPHLMKDARNSLLKLRETSDAIAEQSNSRRPSKDAMMLGFYQRYPFRALVDEAPTSEDTQNATPMVFAPARRRSSIGLRRASIGCDIGIPLTGQRRKSVCEEHNPFVDGSGVRQRRNSIGLRRASIGCDIGTPLIGQRRKSVCEEDKPFVGGSGVRQRRESGYLSQAPSAELLKQNTILETSAVESRDDSTSSSSPDKSSVSSPSSPLSLPAISITTPLKEKVMNELVEVVRNDLDETDMPAETIAQTNVFTLGLDSLNLMEVRDFILRDYGFDFGLSELMELETIAAMAELVVSESIMATEEENKDKLVDESMDLEGVAI